MSITRMIYDPDDGTGGTGKPTSRKKELTEYEKILKRIEEMRDAESELSTLQRENLKILGKRRDLRRAQASEKISAMRKFAEEEAAALNESGGLQQEQIERLEKMTDLQI